jgi:hypothetical protein
MGEKINQLFIAVSVDKDGTETILYAKPGDEVIPLVTSKEELVDRMYDIAAADAISNGKEVKILQFARRGEMILGDVEGEDFKEEIDVN